MENVKTDLLLQAVVSMINSSITSLDKGVSWLSIQLPEVVQQYLAWKLSYNLIYGLLFLGVTLLFLVVVPLYLKNKYKKDLKEYTEDKPNCWRPDPDPFLALGTISVIVGGTMVFFTLSYMLEVLQIIIAPKVYLIEWAANLVRSNIK